MAEIPLPAQCWSPQPAPPNNPPSVTPHLSGRTPIAVTGATIDLFSRRKRANISRNTGHSLFAAISRVTFFVIDVSKHRRFDRAGKNGHGTMQHHFKEEALMRNSHRQSSCSQQRAMRGIATAAPRTTAASPLPGGAVAALTGPVAAASAPTTANTAAAGAQL